MINKAKTLALALGLLGLAACATSRPVADVTRFHTNPPPASGTIALVPPSGTQTDSLAFKAEADALKAALTRAGFSPVTDAKTAQWLLEVNYGRDSQALGESAPPVTIGVGAGSWGGNLGIGIGTSFGVGKGKMQRAVSYWLNMAIYRASDRTRVWEGRARSHAIAESDEPSGTNLMTTHIDQLAQALLAGYPGPSGQTVVVKLDPQR